MTAAVATPLRWHGGKAPLAGKIRDLFPPRETYLHYVEPFAGGLSVLLADPDGGEGISEVVNDLNSELTDFWRVLGNVGDWYPRFQRHIETVPFSEIEWNDSTDSWEKPGIVDRAASFFIRCRQSLAGRMKGFSPVSRTRTRRGMNEQVSGWLTAIEGLPAVHARLKRVLILNRPALDVIRQQDGEKTLFYIDPPYLHETRATTSDYTHEMSGADHIELLDSLKDVSGRFLLSGYRSQMYDDVAERYGWRRVDFEVANHAAGGEKKRKMTECVWMNH